MSRLAPAPFATWLAVGSGAGLGSLLRVFVSALATSVPGGSAMLGAALVNVAGSFAIVAFAELTGPDARAPLSPTARQFVMAGLCGGFTTFSALSLEAFVLMRDDRIWTAGAYLATVLGLSLAAALAGHLAARRLNRRAAS